MFSLICVWINGWINNREAGDLRRYRHHYDVIVMLIRNVSMALFKTGVVSPWLTQWIYGSFALSHRDDINSLRPRPNRRHFADDIFKCIFENENEWISPRISLKFVPKVQINNIPVLVQIMAWRRPGDKPLSESKMVILPTHICVTRPQWVKWLWHHFM